MLQVNSAEITRGPEHYCQQAYGIFSQNIITFSGIFSNHIGGEYVFEDNVSDRYLDDHFMH